MKNTVTADAASTVEACTMRGEHGRRTLVRVLGQDVTETLDAARKFWVRADFDRKCVFTFLGRTGGDEMFMVRELQVDHEVSDLSFGGAFDLLRQMVVNEARESAYMLAQVCEFDRGDWPGMTVVRTSAEDEGLFTVKLWQAVALEDMGER